MLLWLNQRTAAAGRPYVQMSVSDYETGDAAGFSISFTNAGVGPARMHGILLTINGEAIRDWRQAIKSVDGESTAEVGRNFVSVHVISGDDLCVV
jgi:hypothetical protein